MSNEKRKSVGTLLEKIGNPFNDEFIQLTREKYRIEQIVQLAEELETRYEFKKGTRVQMLMDYKEEVANSGGGGWDYHAGHFLYKWNVGTVTDISHINNGVITVYVQWDYQPSRDGKENSTDKFPFSEKNLKHAEIDKPKIPRKFKCPDEDKKEKTDKIKRIKLDINKKEKELKTLMKELKDA